MHSSTFGKGWVGMSACPLVVLACESLHVCTVCIWRCEHARFCVEVFYALYINFHSFIQLSQLSDSSPACISDLLTVYIPSRQLRLLHSHGYFVSPILKYKKQQQTNKQNNTLTNAVSPTVPQSDGVLSLLTDITFNPPEPSKLQWKLT